MSDPVNANPTVVDVSDIPTRLSNNKAASKTEEKDRLVERLISLSLIKNAFSDDDILFVSDGSEAGESYLLTDAELEAKYAVSDSSDDEEDPIDAQEIYDLVSSISDPEHPLTLAQLAVVNLEDISVVNGNNKNFDLSEVLIKITPTITHCSLATLIGLGIRVRLERSLPARFRIRIVIKEGTHQSEGQVNKQLNDKERVAAACENDQLSIVVLQMLSTCK